MYRYEDLIIRKFKFEDIPNKIKWINNSENNTYLHYDLPLEYDKTCAWFERTKDREDRYDAVIEYQGIPVGLAGLLAIDYKNKKAEDYLIVGEVQYKNKGIGTRAGHLILLYAFQDLSLNKICAYIDKENEITIKSNLKRGFEIEGCLRQDVCRNGKFVDRYCVGICKDRYKIPEGVFRES